MKTAVVVGAVVVVLGAVLFVIWGRQSAPAPEGEDHTPVLATTLQQTLVVTHGQATTSAEVAQSEEVYQGDRLETLHTGRALLQSINGTQTLLDYDTQVTITVQDPTGGHQRFSLALGGVWSRVEKVLGQGEFYEIETQNAVAAVRGTAFGVAYRNGLTTLEVENGVVGVIPVDPATHTRLLAKEIAVRAGSKATIDDEGTVTVTTLTDTDKKASWYQLGATAALPIQSSPEPSAPPKPAATVVPATSVAPTPTPTTTALTLTSITPPDRVVIPGRVYAKGSGFKTLVAVVVGKVRIPPSDVTITSDTTFDFSTQALMPGTYTLSVADAAGHSVALPGPLVVVDRSTPPVPPGTPPPSQPPY